MSKSANDNTTAFDICIVGGCGHVGLPLGLAFADNDKKVVLYDINKTSIDKVNNGVLPFMEKDAKSILKRVTKNKTLIASNKKEVISQSKAIVMVIGTPVDGHLNPMVDEVFRAISDIEKYLNDDHLLILRSTLYPGVTEKIQSYLLRKNIKALVAFCPERIVEGQALTELYTLPQIVAGCTPKASIRAGEVFKTLTSKIIVTKPMEAELAKLFTNTWRYINFAISNQFYMIANSHNLDFYNIYNAMTDDYPRLKSFAKAGLSAGPCLFKDTMQLSSFSGNNFFLGHSAMLVNEGLTDFIVDTIRTKHKLSTRTVAILGMAFKSDNDDPRESLSYKLKKRLEIESKKVLCNDPFIKDPRFVSLDVIHEEADIVIVAAPHSLYKNERWKRKTIIDIWNFYGKGGLI